MDIHAESGQLPALEARSTNQDLSLCLESFIFTSIPPERVGLQGEYDHNGLAKRVSLAFSQAFDAAEIANLKVKQRGRVVVLLGQVSSQRMIGHLVTVAMRVSGAAAVEVNGISIIGIDRFYLTDSDPAYEPSYAC